MVSEVPKTINWFSDFSGKIHRAQHIVITVITMATVCYSKNVQGKISKKKSCRGKGPKKTKCKFVKTPQKSHIAGVSLRST